MTDDPFLAPPGNAPPPPPAPQAPPPYQAPAGYIPPAPVQPSYPQEGYGQPGYAQQGYAQQGYAQQGYSQPYPAQLPPPMPYAPRSLPKTWMNWVAFGCGLGAFVSCGVSFIPAIVFGHLALVAAKRGEADKKGFAITGLVIGYVFLAVRIAYIALMVSRPEFPADSIQVMPTTRKETS